jgi:DASS family divalent anion:Na+ symporter
MPVVHSIAQTLGSTPSHHPEMGGFLMLLGSHANLLSASMYLTGKCVMRSFPFCIQRLSSFFIGMAPNPIVLAKANQLFPNLNFTFMTWLSGSILPALLCALCLPLILSRLMLRSTSEPKQSRNDHIVEHARQELATMGKMSKKEKVKRTHRLW